MRDIAVSFVIPAYNCQDTLTEAVESIFAGNFSRSSELIIVDDGSIDNTAKVIRLLKRKFPVIKVIRNQHNIGCPASRNIGISKAKNSLVYNLDSDNILAPKSVNELALYLLSKDADMAAFGEIHFFRNDMDHLEHKWKFRQKVLTLKDFLSTIQHPGQAGNFMFTKKSWQKIGGYWEYGKGLHEAWGFTLKQLSSGAKFVVMPNSYYFHRFGHESLFIRESQATAASSEMATKIISNVFHLLDERDVAYIQSRKGSKIWFDQLNVRPIRLKTRLNLFARLQVFMGRISGKIQI